MPPEDLPTAPSLADLRDRINGLDSEIVGLLRRRAELAGQVKHFKEANDLPVYSPARERDILAGLTPERLGDFPVDGARAVFREIISACRSLEEFPRIAYLGPAGTFAEMAARNLYGECSNYIPYEDFAPMFDAVYSGDCTFAVAPIENSTAGTIREVVDLLVGGRLTIINETYVDVHHCLLSQSEVEDIEVVYSKDTALEQCRAWLRLHLGGARQIPVSSTAMGVERAADNPKAAAIGTERAAEVFAVPIRARSIEDRSDNRTRFFALGHYMPQSTGRDKTTVRLAVEHRPGALVDALEIFRRHGLNMTLIESRPSRSAPFEYDFFIDFEGHSRDGNVMAAIADLERCCLIVQVLGSYPRAA